MTDTSRPSLAAVLFTDVVGSTELRTRLGEDAAEDLRRRHDAALTRAARENAGRVVKGLGDGIMVVFPSAAEAVSAAAAMQQAALGLGAGRAVSPLTIRVGISAGDLTFESADAFGTPVVEAARLCACAVGGQILASDVVRVLAGARCGDMFAPVGELSLKGLPEPVTAWEVRWEPLPAVAMLPRGLSSNRPWSFVGRRDELKVLESAWEEALGGNRSVVVVCGEPGIGKTRLLAEFALGVARSGGQVLYGRAEEEVGVPYEPFAEALDDYLRASPADVLAVQLGRSAGELVRLVPYLASAAPDLPEPLRADPETERYRLFEAVREVLEAIARDRPLLFALDDLHWATKADAMLLAHVLRSSAAVPMLLVAAFRDTEVDAAHPLEALLDDASRLADVRRLRLAGLNAEDVGELVAEAAGDGVADRSEDLAPVVHTETSGNPFFVCEVLHHLLDQGSSDHVEQSTEPDDVPAGVRVLVGRRIARLPGRAPEVLAVAAVIGVRFDLPLLLAVVADDIGEPAGLDALAHAEVAALVSPEPDRPGWYRFAHALTRTALTATMPSAQRLALHDAVGRALERLPDAGHRTAELAHHFAVAAPLGELDRAIDYLRRAGDQAIADLAFEEAALYYKRALDLVDQQPATDEPARCDLLIDLGEAKIMGAQAESREVLLEAARLAERLGDAERLARAALAPNPGFFSSGLGEDAERVAALRAALELAGPAPTASRARLLARLAAEIYASADRAEREALIGEALTVANALNDDATLGYVLVQERISTWSATNLDRRLAAARELRAIADRLDDPLLKYFAADAFSSYLGAGDIDEAERCLIEERRIVQLLGRPYFRWCLTAWHETMWALHAGRFTEAEQLADEGLELGMSIRDPAEAFGYWAQAMASIRFEQGRLGELVSVMEESLADGEPGIHVHAWLALAYSEAGRADDARSLMAGIATEDFDWIVGEGHTAVTTAALLAETAFRVGDRRWVERILPVLRPCCGQIATVVSNSWGAVDRYVGLCLEVVGDAQAATNLEAAIAVNQRSGAPSWEARSSLDLAALLSRSGGQADRTRAAQLASSAARTADLFGMARVAQHARDLLEIVA
jgi:class 3 adenylate cyclase/tetratricopeptide (TPR) repeat protein